jgi:DNA-binding Xre family transcriptional regulator
VIALRTYIDAVKVDYFKNREGIVSDRELAVKAGIGINTLTSAVRKGRPFDSTTLDKLAAALACTPLDLTTVEGTAPELFSRALAAESSLCPAL